MSRLRIAWSGELVAVLPLAAVDIAMFALPAASDYRAYGESGSSASMRSWESASYGISTRAL